MGVRQVLLVAGILFLAVSACLAIESIRYFVVHDVRGVHNDLRGRIRLQRQTFASALDNPKRMRQKAEKEVPVEDGPTEVVSCLPLRSSADEPDVPVTMQVHGDTFVVTRRLSSYDQGNAIDVGRCVHEFETEAG